MSTRTLTWYETQKDADRISHNEWNLQIAQKVATSNAAAKANVIWQSVAVAPSTSIAWNAEYALNWAADLPSSGVQIHLKGKWQPCNPGESFDIGLDGFWKPSTPSTGDAGWLNVGNVGYQYGGSDGLHIVVGLKNSATNSFQSLFIDSAVLPLGSSARFQLKETMTWWLSAGTLTGEVFSASASSTATKDFSKPNGNGAYEWWTTYKWDDGKWYSYGEAPEESMLALPPSVTSDFGNIPPIEVTPPRQWVIKFTAGIAVSILTSLTGYLLGRLDPHNARQITITVDTANGAKITVSVVETPLSGMFVGCSHINTVLTADEIRKAMQLAVDDGMIPKNTPWAVMDG